MAFVAIAGNPAPDGAIEETFTGRRGVAIRVMRAPARGAARGSVLICPGRTEFIEKYFEVARHLQADGFAIFCIDWRGQGLSGRETKNPQKGHFVSLDDPAADLAIAMAIASSPTSCNARSASRLRPLGFFPTASAKR